MEKSVFNGCDSLKKVIIPNFMEPKEIGLSHPGQFEQFKLSELNNFFLLMMHEGLPG